MYFVFEGKKIYYDETGSGPPLLLLHGNTASSRMFARIRDAYSPYFRVVLMDFSGHGSSDRLDPFPEDLWYYEGLQVVAFLKEKQYTSANIIGSSGGAIAGINAALEAPELVNRIIADSFEGKKADPRFTDRLLAQREQSKSDEKTRAFYSFLHGPDWESIVDADTSAIRRHSLGTGDFFHRSLLSLEPEILLTGSRKDPFMYSVSDDYYERVYGEMLKEIPKGRMYLFPEGDHPAMLSNFREFFALSMRFFLP